MTENLRVPTLLDDTACDRILRRTCPDGDTLVRGSYDASLESPLRDWLWQAVTCRELQLHQCATSEHQTVLFLRTQAIVLTHEYLSLSSTPSANISLTNVRDHYQSVKRARLHAYPTGSTVHHVQHPHTKIHTKQVVRDVRGGSRKDEKGGRYIVVLVRLLRSLTRFVWGQSI